MLKNRETMTVIRPEAEDETENDTKIQNTQPFGYHDRDKSVKKGNEMKTPIARCGGDNHSSA